MITVAERPDRVAASLLGRASPLLTLVVAVAWAVALTTTLDPRPPLLVGGGALVAGLGAGRLAPGTFVRGAGPLWLAVATVVASNALLAGSNADPAVRIALAAGPVRISEPALAAAGALGLRVIAIVLAGITWGRVTEPTRLADALVQQARLPDRFAYGALAALQAIPWIADDLAALREARRMRGLGSSWHPRVLVGLLVLAIRRAERLAVAMDARGFAATRRTRFRLVAWSAADTAVLAGGLGVLAAIILLR